MTGDIDHYLLVPDATGTSLLVERKARRNVLPCVRGRTGAAGVVEALAERFGLRAPFLRTACAIRDDDGAPVAVLRELDGPRSGWDPPPGLAWLDLDRAEPQALAPAAFEVEIARWLSEQRGSPVPEARPAWARPGWLAEASAWIEERSAALGFEARGAVRVVAHWSLSSVLCLETTDGAVFFKAVFPLFDHEPAITRALAAEHPGMVPDVLAVDETRGWMLMRELQGVPIGDEEATRWRDGLRAAATIQRAWVGRSEELLALGAHDRTLAALRREIRDHLGRAELAEPDRRRLDAVTRSLEAALDELASGPIPETLVHGDLHPWNVMATSDEVTIFDWSDACVSHPFFDLTTYLERAPDEDVRRALLDVYLEQWSDRASAEEVRSLAASAEALAEVHHSISYQRIGDALEPADRALFAGEPARRLLHAIELAEAGGVSATTV